MTANPHPDENELLRRYRADGDVSAREALVEHMMPLVRRLAQRYANRGQDLEDLVQVGSVGLLKAIDRFDFDRGVRLATFAEPNIAGEIKRHFRDHGWSVRPPRDLQELYAKVSHAIDELTGSLGRSPTIAELATATDSSQEEVLEAIHAGAGYESASLSALEETNESNPSLATADGGLARSEWRATLGEGLSALDGRSQAVIHMRFFEDLTQREIAERVGVSQMQVSRILRGALRQLREAFEIEDPT